MVEKIFYNSSLPRSGSTLIQNILAQNPDIHSTPTSGLVGMLSASRSVYSNSPEFKAQDEKLMEEGFKSYLKNGIYGFYNVITDRKYVMEKSRGWSMEYKFIDFYDSKPKIICMVRDLRGVFASMEKKFRSNPQKELGVINWETLQGTTTDKRIARWSSLPPIGPAIDSLYQVLLEGLHENFLFVRYEDLCSNPNEELTRIYDYLEIPYFQHDFENIEQLTHEDDRFHGVFGDHIIRKKLESLKENFEDILGETACGIITTNYKWFYDVFEYKI
jgi:sulfotransferase